MNRQKSAGVLVVGRACDELDMSHAAGCRYERIRRLMRAVARSKDAAVTKLDCISVTKVAELARSTPKTATASAPSTWRFVLKTRWRCPLARSNGTLSRTRPVRAGMARARQPMDSWPATPHTRPRPVPDRTPQNIARLAEDGGGKEREPGAQPCQPQVRSAERICLPPTSLALLSVAQRADPTTHGLEASARPIRERCLAT